MDAIKKKTIVEDESMAAGFGNGFQNGQDSDLSSKALLGKVKVCNDTLIAASGALETQLDRMMAENSRLKQQKQQLEAKNDVLERDNELLKESVLKLLAATKGHTLKLKERCSIVENVACASIGAGEVGANVDNVQDEMEDSGEQQQEDETEE